MSTGTSIKNVSIANAGKSCLVKRISCTENSSVSNACPYLIPVTNNKMREGFHELLQRLYAPLSADTAEKRREKWRSLCRRKVSPKANTSKRRTKGKGGKSKSKLRPPGFGLASSLAEIETVLLEEGYGGDTKTYRPGTNQQTQMSEV